MGVLVDIVPNHVGIARPWENAWWWHVLTHGQDSPYADAFDIDWEAGGGRVRIPVVGDDDLARRTGTIDHLRGRAGELHYHDQRFPLAPGSADDMDEPAPPPRTCTPASTTSWSRWRTADADLNYRRFFAVNTLAAIRVEDPEWFDRSHEEIGRWFDRGARRRPAHRPPRRPARPRAATSTTSPSSPAAPTCSSRRSSSPARSCRATWATAGTTGYDALALIDRVLTDPAAAEAARRARRPAARRARRLGRDDPRHQARRRRRHPPLGGAPHRPRAAASAIPDAPADTEDAVAELLACFPVYRSYLPDGREHLDEAFAARPGAPARPGRRRSTCCSRCSCDPAPPPALRFQQTSGMVMAKGVEDCAFYRWSRLTSLNEVGGDPSVFSVDRRRVPRRDGHPAGRVAARDDRAVDPRHQARRGRPGPDRRAGRGPRDLGAARSTGCSTWCPLPDPGFGNLLWQAVVGAWPAAGLDGDCASGCTRTPRRRCARPATAPRGPSPTRPTRRPCTPPSTPRSTGPRCAPCSTRCSPPSPTPAGATPWPPSWSRSRCRACPTSTRAASCGSRAWSTPTTAARSTSTYAARCSHAVEHGERPALTGGVDDPGAAKLLVTRAGLLAPPRPARALHVVRRRWPRPARPPTTCWPSTAAAPSPSATRLPLGLAARGGWGDTTLALPAGGVARRALRSRRHRRRAVARRPAGRPARSRC